MEKPCLTDTQDTASTWDFWVQSIGQPDAYKWVNGLNGATVALNLKSSVDRFERYVGNWVTDENAPCSDSLTG